MGPFTILNFLWKGPCERPKKGLDIGGDEVIGQNNHELLEKQHNNKPGA